MFTNNRHLVAVISIKQLPTYTRKTNIMDVEPQNNFFRRHYLNLIEQKKTIYYVSWHAVLRIRALNNIYISIENSN